MIYVISFIVHKIDVIRIMISALICTHNCPNPFVDFFVTYALAYS